MSKMDNNITVPIVSGWCVKGSTSNSSDKFGLFTFMYFKNINTFFSFTAVELQKMTFSMNVLGDMHLALVPSLLKFYLY